MERKRLVGAFLIAGSGGWMVPLLLPHVGLLAQAAVGLAWGVCCGLFLCKQ